MRLRIIIIVLVFFIAPVQAIAGLGHGAIILAANDRHHGESRKSGRPKYSKQKAAAKAKRAHPNNKVLSLKLIGGSGPPVYRLKMLSAEGVVKYVFVDGNSGVVFE